jgi:phage protein U
MADTGKAWPMIEGSGTVYGLYVIEEMSETGSLFFADGSARKIDFSMKLARIDDDRIDLLGAITSSLLALL